MKLSNILFSVVFVLLLVCSAIAEEGETTSSYSLWIGNHYTDFTDYTKKVGEYNLGENEWLPEVGLKYFSRSDNGYYLLKGYYYDEKNAFGLIDAKYGNGLSIKAQYRSLIKQEGQDLLTNMEAREYLPETGSMSGKMLTHEILDPGADYNTHRQEILAKVSAVLNEENNVRFEAIHRTILKTGTEQAVSSNHCFSCHMTSQTKEVDNKQHQIEAGISGDVQGFNLGYRFGYRLYESSAITTKGLVDPAKHPVNGGAGSEFTSRMIYSDGMYEFDQLPKTEKMSHKVKFKKNFGTSYFAGSFVYANAENKNTSLESNSYSGAVNFAHILNKTTRLILKGAVAKYEADSIFIDLPTYRENAADSNYYDFDYTRYSALDRTTAKFSAELVKRFNPKMMLNFLAGYDMTDRDNWKTYDDGISTKKLYLQAKMRYRKGSEYSTSLKLRFENITDPFVSSKGLFEAPGYDVLEPLVGTSTWVFYFQREDLRYQLITNQPTKVMSFDWKSNYKASDQLSLILGVKGQYDKNDDLDSLEIEHTSLIPSVSLNYNPDVKVAVNAGYVYNYSKNNLPITVAMFDG